MSESDWPACGGMPDPNQVVVVTCEQAPDAASRARALRLAQQLGVHTVLDDSGWLRADVDQPARPSEPSRAQAERHGGFDDLDLLGRVGLQVDLGGRLIGVSEPERHLAQVPVAPSVFSAQVSRSVCGDTSPPSPDPCRLFTVRCHGMTDRKLSNMAIRNHANR